MLFYTSVFKNTLAQGAGKAVTIIFALFITAIITRSLGVEGYGKYTFITAFVLLFGNIADWGTSIISVREASSNVKSQPNIYGSVTLFRLFLSILALLFANLAVRLNPSWYDLVLPTTLASLVLVALSLKTSINMVFQTSLRFNYSVLVEIFASVSFLVCILLLPQKLDNILFGWLVSTLLATLLGYILTLKITKYVWGLDFIVIRKIAKAALPAGALFLVFTIYNRIDTLILQNYAGAGAVGVYGLAYKIHDNLVMGAAFLMNSLFPALSQNFSDNKLPELKNLYQKSFDFLFIASAVLFISIYAVAPFLINILGGSSFSESLGPLRILLIATAISYFNHLTGYSLLAFGKQKLSLFIAAFALSLNIILNIIFIPFYSYYAAAWATVATEGVVLILSSIVIRNTIGIYPSLSSWIKTIMYLAKISIKKI